MTFQIFLFSIEITHFLLNLVICVLHVCCTKRKMLPVGRPKKHSLLWLEHRRNLPWALPPTRTVLYVALFKILLSGYSFLLTIVFCSKAQNLMSKLQSSFLILSVFLACPSDHCNTSITHKEVNAVEVNNLRVFFYMEVASWQHPCKIKLQQLFIQPFASLVCHWKNSAMYRATLAPFRMRAW